ncbi:MAG: methyltransferase type 11 [Nitrospira bacterium HGW-Nitrospira-1]|nr:MAG: methyltransferase type 11 [Nitrospira bacterium HGW-Nitrospira-1]
MTYEFDGKKYEKASTHQKEWGAKLIAELGLRGSERVLDLGCGDGTLTAQIADLVPAGEVIGIDASQGMIDIASQKHRDNMRFILMDINHLDFAEQFDVVFSNATLHWVCDHQRLLRNVKRALRDAGVLRFNFAGDGNCSNFFKVIKEAMDHGAFSKYFGDFEWPWYMPPVEQYRSLVEQSGFKDAHVWGENADRYFPDVENMIRWVDQPSLVPFLARVPEEDKTPFREFIVRRMIEETRQDDGKCFETFRRINVLARK